MWQPVLILRKLSLELDALLDLSPVLEKRFMVETLKSRRASARVSFSNLFLVKRAEDGAWVI